jgi:tetratricopeptide (TPR) repeat protein
MMKEQKKEFDELMKLGTTQRTERKYEESLESFKKALALFPDNAEAIKQVAAAEKWIKALEEL